MTKIISGQTPSGCKFSIAREALDDWEMFEDLAKVDSGDLSALIRVLNNLFSDEDISRLKEHCRSESGRVSATKMLAELNDVFTASGEKAKNS